MSRIDTIGQNGNDGLHYDLPTAPSILLQAREHLTTRASTYDSPAGERSIAKAAAIFNAATGRDLSPRDGWLFMIALKLARSTQPGHNADDYEDLAAYAALYGEEAAQMLVGED